MDFQERYRQILAEEAARHREAAAKAKARGDERTHSVELMQASMLGPMLEQLGKVEHEKIRPGLLQKEIDFMLGEQKRYEAMNDYDQADRWRLKAETARFALQALRTLEAEQAPEAKA